MNAGYWRRYLRRASPISSFVDCQQPVLSPPVSARGFAVRTSRALYRWPTPSGQRKTRSMVAHGALIFSSFSAGKHLSVPCGVTNYENLFVACNCERAEHRPSAGDWQELSSLSIQRAGRVPHLADSAGDVRKATPSALNGGRGTISSRAKFFRRGAARQGDGTPRHCGTWPMCK